MDSCNSAQSWPRLLTPPYVPLVFTPVCSDDSSKRTEVVFEMVAAVDPSEQLGDSELAEYMKQRDIECERGQQKMSPSTDFITAAVVTAGAIAFLC